MINKKDLEIVKNTSEEDFKDYLGVNAYKFFDARNRLLEGKITCWSWMPLLGAGWAGYYKWWLGICQTCLAALAFGWLGLIAVPIVWGFFGRTAVVVKASKKIAELRLHENNPERLKEMLRAAGKPSILTAITGVVLTSLSLGISFAILGALSEM